MKRMELLPVTEQNRIVAVEKPQKYAYYYFSQIITTLVPVGKARETKVSYVEINCRRRRKILHIFGPSVLLA